MRTLRVSKAEIPSQLRESMIKQFGAVAEPVEVTWHNPKVAQAALEFGAKIAAFAVQYAAFRILVTNRIRAAPELQARLKAHGIIAR